jgi:cell division protein FtsW (lipid II flippase)
VARMGLVAILMILGIHIGNRSITFRLFSLIIVSILGLYVFYSPRFQEKSFSSGHGDLSDISLNYYENETFKTSGRMTWRLALESGLEEAPLFGNGPRSENIAFTYIGAPHSEAHNDFLSVRYNYGWIGLYTLLFGFFIQFISLFRRKKQYQTTYSFILWSGTLTLFPVFLLFMYSDNILKYTIFFPNYFFAMIGILYSNSLNQDVSKPLLKR